MPAVKEEAAESESQNIKFEEKEADKINERTSLNFYQ